MQCRYNLFLPRIWAEIKSLHLTSSDEEWHLSAMVKIIDEVYGAGSYVMCLKMMITIGLLLLFN
jgi:hypothetical protein